MQGAQVIKTLLIDNYDSFTYNLYHLIAAVNGCPPVVIKNDDPDWKPEMASGFDNVVISPGPGRPDNPADFGICRDVIAKQDIPVLGICLGHQGICHFHGSRIDLAVQARHGRMSPVIHDGTGIFENIPSPFSVVRYHSLAVYDIPESLDVTARSEDGVIMGIRHKTLPQWGVQFHPESICTEHGLQIFRNFRKLTDNWQKRGRTFPDNPVSLLKPPLKQIPDSLTKENVVLLHRKMALDVDSETVFGKCFRNSEYAIWLDSNRQDYGSGRFSYLCTPGGTLGRIATVDIQTHCIHIETKSGRSEMSANFFEWLESDLNRFDIQSPETYFEFALGWVGYVGYEMKGDCDAGNGHRSPYPDSVMAFCDRGIVIDHQEKQVHLLALAPHDNRSESEEWLENTSGQLSQIKNSVQDDSHDLPETLELDSPFILRHDKKKYIELIRKSQEYIRQGQTYEVCLTNMATAPSSADPWTAYRMLRRSNPAPYSAFLQLGDISVLSCSPERFISIANDRIAESKPIKGTRGRSPDPVEDKKLHDELLLSEKEKAENLMIVDLVRHDLGKTAELNSVEVTKLFAIESYRTVHQMVSTIRSKIRMDASQSQCIRDAFPGGSMTGAPKIRTMQILDDLEEGARGIYSGAIGYFSLSGAVDLSIVIRTLVMSHGTVSFGIGGAITAMSDPEEEFDEIRVKAKAFLDLFNTGFSNGQEPHCVR